MSLMRHVGVGLKQLYRRIIKKPGFTLSPSTARCVAQYGSIENVDFVNFLGSHHANSPRQRVAFDFLRAKHIFASL